VLFSGKKEEASNKFMSIALGNLLDVPLGSQFQTDFSNGIVFFFGGEI